MSSELAMNEETIAKIVSELQQSIEVLAMRQRDLIKVGGQAFGASPGGTSAHKAADRAHEALDETLHLLRAAHDEFTQSLETLKVKLVQTDEQSRADAGRLRARVEEIAGIEAANAEVDRQNAAQGVSS